jgi:hypothetical protein
MKIYLHIGTEKTGTTTLQRFLNLNRRKLHEQNTLYPTSPGIENHAKLSVYSLNIQRKDELKKFFNVFSEKDHVKFRLKFKKELTNEIKKFTPKKIILSNEHCSTRLINNEEILRLKELLYSISKNVKIIIYLRRQDDYFLSTYSTWIKCGGSNKINIPKNFESVYIQNRYNYKLIIDRWAKYFGEENIIIRVFELEQMVGNSLIDDFLFITKVNYENFVVPNDLNSSLSSDVLEFLRIFNKYIPFFNENGINPERGDLNDILEEISTKNKIHFRGAEKLYENFKKENESIAKIYLKRKDGILFKSNRRNIQEIYDDQLCVERAVEISSIMWKHMQIKLNDLRRKIANSDKNAS